MSFSIELPQTYTFSLCIDRGGRTIVDTTVEVPDTREGITKAKRTIQRLMNEYAPVPKAPDLVGLNPESQPSTDPPPAAETAPTPSPEKKPEGARGLLRLHCPECGNTVYPGIAPVVMVAVTDGDRLLLTKYADRFLPQWVLISGFVEAGETLEEAAEREVYEETGIRIRDLQYFGSQPWGFSGSVIAGYTARLDGPDGIRLDRKELAAAEWHLRSRLPDELTDISIAHEMIESLRL